MPYVSPDRALSPAEIMRRLAARECLRCGLAGMRPDTGTGFHDHYCGTCKAAIADAERRARKAARA